MQTHNTNFLNIQWGIEPPNRPPLGTPVMTLKHSTVKQFKAANNCDCLLHNCDWQICRRTYLSDFLDHGATQLTRRNPALSVLVPGIDGETFTKTRHVELTRTHCRSDSGTVAVRSRPAVRLADRCPLNTVNTRNRAAASPASFALSLLTADTVARTTDSENTVATRTSTGRDCTQGLGALSQDTRVAKTGTSKHSRYLTRRPPFERPSNERQLVIAASSTCYPKTNPTSLGVDGT